jgi:peptide/nickel transport system permease protein
VTVLSPSFWNIVWAIGLLSWPGIARIVRANILSLREREFFLAARAIGASSSRIIFKHLLPNTLAPVIANTTLTVAGAILDGKPYLASNIWYTLFPGLFIFLTVMAVNFLGDGLCDALDPKLSTEG